MKNRLYLSLVLIALTCLAGWTAHAQLQRSSPARQTWEYKEVLLAARASSVPSLDALGAQGWELVGVTSACRGELECSYWAYMKRAK
jgi:hypothetical protein